MLELLSPAGSFASLKAAVSGGADAVYFGASKFNARINADNFQEKEISDSIKYCHNRGVKCHAVLNTLVLNKEMEEVLDLASFFVDSGIDALIVQDVGLAYEIRKRSDIPIHASTQMTIHSADGVKLLEQMGYSRAVLSRELSRNDIEIIRSGISPEFELEIFVHGALCFSYSGQCYMSSIIGGRSGNRGCCAQPCRLPYEKGYSLSLKDLCMIRDLDILRELKIDSLKIEGRMKSPEYVYYVTKAYADAIRGMPPTEDDIRTLSEIFSRSGFTNGYFHNKTGKDMFGTKQNNSERVLNPVPNTEYPRHYLDIECRYKPGPDSLTVTFRDENGNTAYSEIPLQKAINASLTNEKVAASLSKLGNTVYKLNSISVDIPPSFFAPVSSLNDARRSCLNSLEEYLHSGSYKFNKQPFHIIEQKSEKAYPKRFRGFFLDVNRVPDNASLLDELIFRIEDIDNPTFKNIFLKYRGKIILSLPTICEDTEYDELSSLLNKAQSEYGISDFLINNLGYIQLFKDNGNVTLHGDYGLNVFNASSRDYLLNQFNLKDLILSFELSHGFAQELSLDRCGIIGYGRLPFMIFKNCIKNNHHEFEFLKDRKNKNFLLSCEFGCRNRLYNADVLWLADKDLSRFGFVQLNFTDENKDKAGSIIDQYIKGTGEMLPGYTRGRYY